MKIIEFEIRNFKGIAKTTVHVAGDVPGNVATLIGLNESGKTTILEALSHFVTVDQDAADLVQTVSPRSSLQELIPKDRKAAFTDDISITATARLDDADIEALVDMFRLKHELILDTLSLPRSFVLTRNYEYEDSTPKETRHLWGITFKLKKAKARKYTEYEPIKNDVSREIWLDGIRLLQKRLPKLVYFPTFLFNFPDRIYLDINDGTIANDKRNEFYKQVMDDVLESQGEGLSIQKHVIDRIERLRRQHTEASTFIGFLFGQDEKKQVDAVLQKVSNKMSQEIFGSWNQILGRNLSGKRVQIDWSLDAEMSNAVYLEVSIIDGSAKFDLSERSLGFRWFFSFLLFTQFRQNRRDQCATIFLFDEPASNLHSKAQMKLLESFARIAQGSTYIIYSTHSHYMVNPMWLEKAYIIENMATDLNREDEVDSFVVRKTDIRAIRYRTFVGSYPAKTTYFQPVLDKLDVTLSPMLRSSKALLVEGKNDYHAFVYFRQKLTISEVPEIFPGNGAGHMSCLISLFRGWGVNFRIILDDDHAGRQAKRKYIKEFLLSPSEVVSLGDICPALNGLAFEGLYKSDVTDAVKIAFSTSAPSKVQYALHFQELLATKNQPSYPETESLFQEISDWLDNEFAG